jgi:nicotinate-nucleotide adenylyltransferase
MTAKSKEIAVFGVTADPPHNGHVLIINYLLDHFAKVIVVPVGNHDYGKKTASVEDRLAMLTDILPAGVILDLFEIEKVEKNPTAINYTHETLLALQKKYPREKLVFVIGSDNKDVLHWKDHRGQNGKAMLNRFKFYVYPRKGFVLVLLHKNLSLITDVKAVDVSSTEIRDKIRAGEDIEDLVPRSVAEYIKNNKLYLI